MFSSTSHVHWEVVDDINPFFFPFPSPISFVSLTTSTNLLPYTLLIMKNDTKANRTAFGDKVFFLLFFLPAEIPLGLDVTFVFLFYSYIYLSSDISYHLVHMSNISFTQKPSSCFFPFVTILYSFVASFDRMSFQALLKLRNARTFDWSRFLRHNKAFVIHDRWHNRLSIDQHTFDLFAKPSSHCCSPNDRMICLGSPALKSLFMTDSKTWYFLGWNTTTAVRALFDFDTHLNLGLCCSGGLRRCVCFSKWKGLVADSGRTVWQGVWRWWFVGSCY